MMGIEYAVLDLRAFRLFVGEAVSMKLPRTYKEGAILFFFLFSFPFLFLSIYLVS